MEAEFGVFDQHEGVAHVNVAVFLDIDLFHKALDTCIDVHEVLHHLGVIGVFSAKMDKEACNPGYACKEQDNYHCVGQFCFLSHCISVVYIVMSFCARVVVPPRVCL